jgi:hypothetical protein
MENEIKHKKAKTHKGRKFLESRLPKAVEDPKLSLFINTANSNEILRMVLNDLVKIYKLIFSTLYDGIIRKNYRKKISSNRISMKLNSFAHRMTPRYSAIPPIPRRNR